MSESGKITSSHLCRAAVIYVRQSTLIQAERNTESTARQYDLVRRARQLGWPAEAIQVVDGDLGISGSVTGQRAGFEGIVAEVALGQVGIILALEASRLARDNAAWYRLLDLAGVCDTLVADADGVYHPALFTDRLVLGLMGIMAESELHVLRARLEGGIKNKAARGELRRGLPAGLIWGEAGGEICFHPDEAVTGVLRAAFDQFAVCGSVRATWLWLRAQQLRWPLQQAVYRGWITARRAPGTRNWIITADEQQMRQLRERRARPPGYYTRARWAQPQQEPDQEQGTQP
jgi:DNA invertase Pin-like site-specific DNA recombinase